MRSWIDALIWGLFTLIAGVSIVLAWAIWTTEPQTTLQPQFNWSQQVLRSQTEDQCRAIGRIPFYAEGIYLECLPVRR
jgi:hypothetical protein